VILQLGNPIGSHIMQHLRYRLIYWRRRILLALGVCPKCLIRVNHTTAGRPICPNCAH
jgi:hypothetical protein